MKSAFTFIACFTFLGTQAQQINGYRYWFDGDDGNVVTSTVSSTPELTLAAAWPTTGLAPGFHTVSFQVRDTNGDWSVPHSTLFSRSASDVTGYRYWVNDDVANLVTGAIGPDAVADLNGVVDAGTLTGDYNLVTVQFRDADGEWSVPKLASFVKGTGAVNGYEYWIDDDVANLTSGSIGPDEVVDLIADLPLGITTGTHTFAIRFSSVNGTWSVPLTAQFESFTGIAELPGVTDLLLFPNPVTDQLGLRLETDAARNLQLRVLDLSGSVVLDLDTWAVHGQAYRNWDLSALASGSYTLQITDGTRTWSTLFVKP